MDDVVRDAVMLGVAAVQPLLTARTEVPGSGLQPGRARRALAAHRRGVGQAVRPRRRARHPRRRVSLAGVPRARPLGRAGAHAGSSRRPRRPRGSTALRGVPSPASALVLVGPEGGWTADEVARRDAAGRARRDARAAARCAPTRPPWSRSASCCTCGGTSEIGVRLNAVGARNCSFPERSLTASGLAAPNRV